ncbi:MAG: major facilitator superfamily 1 [Firmicutes bacterium]|nr:major facilitator superfamily 1 [Bacillota bacterium]
MEDWKKNLLVCWGAVFIVSMGMTQMAPILPLYIEHLGIKDPAEIARWSGIVIGCNFISMAIFLPIWGRFADKYGRKSMLLRASLWLSLIVTSMGFVSNVYQLIILRILQGIMSGFQSAVVTLIAAETPKEHSGWALGMLFSGQVGGNLLGPLFGGYLTEMVGFREDFITIGILCFIAFVASYFFVHERNFVPAKKVLGFRDVWDSLPKHKVMMCLFITTLVMQLALASAQPVISVYISQISFDVQHIAMVSGAVFAATGLASVLAAPYLGRISDKIGAHKVLLGALVFAGITTIPQAFVESSLQLGLLRFLQGLAIAGLLPSVNHLLRKTTPDALTGSVFGYNQSAQYLGMFLGAVLGGQMAVFFSIQAIFYVTGVVLLVNAAWVYQTIYKDNAEKTRNTA